MAYVAATLVENTAGDQSWPGLYDLVKNVVANAYDGYVSPSFDEFCKTGNNSARATNRLYRSSPLYD